ncbi:MAG: sigma-54 dependent transcriptional regulator [Desulfosalsimonadaceae bacterium]
MFPSILIVDDEASILKSLSGILSDEGFETLTATNGYEALKTLETESPDLVLLDIWMPGIDGIDTLKEIKQNHPGTQVVMITGHGTIETAVNATKIGAYDFIEKPISIDKVIVAINNALNFRRLEEENQYLRKKTIERNSITGKSPAVQELKKQIQIAAPTDAWVLITGEHGSGKELVARMIHQFSHRADKPLIDVNCAAVSHELMEHELLGLEKGAISKDTARKKGKFELADQGTLFFDEIADMDLKTQATLLRVLQEKKFQRVGGGRTLSIDVRVIASSNKDLSAEMEAGRFREDLYYRLNVIPIEVPPLRQRTEDIPELAALFLEQIAENNGISAKALSAEALEMLRQYSWPGNIREFKNLLERLSITTEKEVVAADDIPSPYNPDAAQGAGRDAGLFAFERLKEARQAFEQEFIRRKLTENQFDTLKTARQIGVEKSFLQKVVKQIRS